MADYLLIGIYSLLALISVSLVVLILRKKKRSQLDGNLIFIALMLLGWELALIAFFATKNADHARYIFDLKLPFVALVVLSWFLYIIRFYGVGRSFPKPVIVALFVIPAFTLVLALTTPWHSFIRSELIITQTTPSHEFIMTRGPWFWYHSAYCYLLLIIAFVVAVRKHAITPREYRKPSSFLMLGLLVSLLGNIAVIVTNSDLDLSLLAGSISALLLYQAMRNYQGFAFLLRARNEAFNCINEAVFILDGSDGIINLNESARTWLSEMGISQIEKSFLKVIAYMGEYSTKCVALDDVESGSDYYLENGTIYNLRKKPIKDNAGTSIGYFAFVSDESENRELIDYLDKHSGIDALTGLSNRRQIEEDLRFLDKEEQYPLAILYCDLNNLKETNDEFGHHVGDVLLRLAADALKSCCPPNARVGRIGGDEYLAALPRSTEHQLKEVITNIAEYLQQEAVKYPFTPSLALGYALKTENDKDIEEVINRADANMFVEKQRMKTERLSAS